MVILRRAIDHDAERAFGAVFAQQDHGLLKIGVAETGACNEKDAFAERGLHTAILQGNMGSDKLFRTLFMIEAGMSGCGRRVRQVR